MKQTSLQDLHLMHKRLLKAARQKFGIDADITIEPRICKNSRYSLCIYIWQGDRIVESQYDTKLNIKQLINWIKSL